MMCDHRSYTLNLSSCEIKARKKNNIQAWTGLEPMTSAMPFFLLLRVYYEFTIWPVFLWSNGRRLLIDRFIWWQET